ncbi:hypothetical protein QVD17_20979 [Tagetes erecta]|uniref:Uncharacterized protein n=1 Tax=Tagetes erecta TaxID=13708 RepID=A0AAD8NRH8_TARER|nr:hypothetical protein QVD17_20979 [Tagetes erecta]
MPSSSRLKICRMVKMKMLKLMESPAVTSGPLYHQYCPLCYIRAHGFAFGCPSETFPGWSPILRLMVTDMLTAAENDTDVLAEVKEGFTSCITALETLTSPAFKMSRERRSHASSSSNSSLKATTLPLEGEFGEVEMPSSSRLKICRMVKMKMLKLMESPAVTSGPLYHQYCPFCYIRAHGFAFGCPSETFPGWSPILRLLSSEHA